MPRPRGRLRIRPRWETKGREIPVFDASFSTTCPHCGVTDRLVVVDAVWTGRIPLTADGFSFLDATLSATADEHVRCDACGQVFPLADVTR
jgi:ribosomal protein S27E